MNKAADRYDAYVQNYGYGADCTHYGCCSDGPIGLPSTVNRKLKQALIVQPCPNFLRLAYAPLGLSGLSGTVFDFPL